MNEELWTSPFRFPDGSLKPIAGADDTEGEEPEAGEEEENNGEGEPEDDEESAGDEGESDDTEGGSGDSEGDADEDDLEPAAEGTVVPPTGKAILDLLASDEEAQAIFSQTINNMMAENARTAEAQKEAAEFQELIKNGDHAEIGRRVLERATAQQNRSQIADEVLRETFQPVYTELFAQPEMQELTAEEKETLNPQKYASDAHYVRAVTEHIQTKRFNKAVEAEVEKRIKSRDEAAKNRKTADVAKTRSVGASPSATQPSNVTNSRGLIAAGLRGFLGESTAESDDE